MLCANLVCLIIFVQCLVKVTSGGKKCKKRKIQWYTTKYKKNTQCTCEHTFLEHCLCDCVMGVFLDDYKLLCTEENLRGFTSAYS